MAGDVKRTVAAYVEGGRDWVEEGAISLDSLGLLHKCSLIYSSMRSDLFMKKMSGVKKQLGRLKYSHFIQHMFDVKESNARCSSSTLVRPNVLFFACWFTHSAETLRGVCHLFIVCT